MRILVIDNGSKHIHALLNRLRDHQVVVRKYGKNSITDADQADLVILSGGRKPIIGGAWFYRRELNLVASTNKPLIGICLGCEIIARAHKLPLKRLARRVRGVKEITIHPSYLSATTAHIFVYEAHRWAIVDAGPFMVIGDSISGAEILRHPTKKMIGFQFHPEVASPSNDGPRLLEMTISMLAKA